jgi:PIN domain nuclease of toxin-antitoxin system
LAQYLIDSHIFLWAIDAPERLLVPERKLLCDVANDVAVSVASFWELSIKFSKGLLPLGPGKAPVSGDYFARQAGIAGFRTLSIEASEAEYMRRLPGIHGDPFDRILIAQALIGGRAMITRDTVFSHYPGLQVFTP